MFLYHQKLISVITILALFLFGNMAIVHAWSTPHKEIVSHSHDGITESHIVKAPDNQEPPHCTKTKVDTSAAQKIHNGNSTQNVFEMAVSFYPEEREGWTLPSTLTYFQYYPWPENHFFWHLLVGETILII